MLLFAIPKFVCSHEIGMCSLLVWKSPNLLNHYCEEKRVREKKSYFGNAIKKDSRSINDNDSVQIAKH